MGISVEFSKPRDPTPGKGSAGMPTQLGGCCTTVSALMEANKAIGNAGFMTRTKKFNKK